MWHRPHTNRIYHAFNKDIFSNEVFRRVEPNGRTMGEYFEQEIRAGLGIDLFPGMLEKDYSMTTKKQKGLLYPLKNIGLYTQYKNGQKAYEDPDRYVPFPLDKMGECEKHDKKVRKMWEEPGNKPKNWLPEGTQDLLENPGADMDKMAALMGSKDACVAECLSAMCKGSARGLAHLAAYMAHKGTFNGKTIMSEATWDDAHSEPDLKSELDAGMITNFCKGGFNQCVNTRDPSFKKPETPLSMDYVRDLVHDHFDNRVGYYGWMGVGGSIFQWNPEHKIGFGYVPFDLWMCDMVNKRASDIQKKIVEIVSKQANTMN